VVGKGVGKAVMAGGFVDPSTGFGVGCEGLDVGKLVGEGIPELGCGDVVVAGFADVGIRVGPGGRMARTVALGDKYFQHLAVQPAHLVGEDGLADWCEGELAAHRAHRWVIGSAQGGRGQGGVGSRLSSSATRSPAPRDTVNPTGPKGLSSRETAFITAALTSGAGARGSGRSNLGTSAATTGRRVGTCSQTRR
jgi:hypothetical protein